MYLQFNRDFGGYYGLNEVKQVSLLWSFPEPSLYENALWLFWIDGEIAHEVPPGSSGGNFIPETNFGKYEP